MNIALVCACPAGTNTGMISVDLAFESLNLKNVSVTRFCSWKNISKKTSIDLEYTELTNISQLENFDKIIFWGDFLHWIEYFKKDWFNKTIKQNPAITFNDASDVWYSLYLLENRIDLQRKTIIFGSTLYGLNSNSFVDSRYLSALKSLYSNCQISMHRDIFSTNFIKQLTAGIGNSEFGCDCSLLLDSSSYVDTVISNQDYFLYSFGRSGQTELLTKFVFDLGKAIGKKPVELKWLSKGTGVNYLIDSIKKIKGSSFIITDIYHFALNSNRENIRTICIGNGNSKIVDTLSDKKKEIFYSQHFQNQNYIYVESIKTLYKETTKETITLLSNTDSFDCSFNFLHSHIQHTKRKLINEILCNIT